MVNDDNFGIEIILVYGKYKLVGENGEDFFKVLEVDIVDLVMILLCILL